jgi:hypothetical protein
MPFCVTPGQIGATTAIEDLQAEITELRALVAELQPLRLLFSVITADELATLQGRLVARGIGGGGAGAAGSL